MKKKVKSTRHAGDSQLLTWRNRMKTKVFSIQFFFWLIGKKLTLKILKITRDNIHRKCLSICGDENLLFWLMTHEMKWTWNWYEKFFYLMEIIRSTHVYRRSIIIFTQIFWYLTSIFICLSFKMYEIRIFSLIKVSFLSVISLICWFFFRCCFVKHQRLK